MLFGAHYVQAQPHVFAQADRLCVGLRFWCAMFCLGVGLAQPALPAGAAAAAGTGALRPAGDWPPVIGAWFLGDADLEPDGYKPFLDAAAAHSPYTLLTTSLRTSKGELVDPLVRDQLHQAVQYAHTLGLPIALDVDIRLARRAFRARYPDEQQEELVLKMLDPPADGAATANFVGRDLTDHMTGNTLPYQCLTTRLVRAYAFVRSGDGIDSATVRDITAQGIRAVAEGPTKLTVTLPAGSVPAGHSVCLIAAHTYLTPDVFAPHLLAFQREIIRQYADLPLAGVMKDEWGFPPDHTGNPAHDRYWFSQPFAQAYAGRSGGRDLVRDCLLMCAGERGGERERQAAINRFGALCRERNAAIEDDCYRAGKETFGPKSFMATHATWTSYPSVQEFRKHGLDWWAATRDVGQTDESAPYPCRTSLAKRWGFPLWFNQYYSPRAAAYKEQLWSGALAGGRLNVHPLYPGPDQPMRARHLGLMQQPFMAGMARMRLLDRISQAPLDCPVAVIFGHACAMNWAGPAYDEVGLDIASALCGQGYPADLFPSSLIGASALRLDGEGSVCLGPQRYRAVVLFHPEFETAATLEFFSQATQGKTAVFVVGDWTRDAEGQPFDALAQPAAEKLRRCPDNAACTAAVLELLEAAGIERRTAWAVRKSGKRFDAVPPPAGHSRLTDGTYVCLAGAKNVTGDSILTNFVSQGHAVAVDAIGLVAIRFAADGKVAAVAAGGLRRLRTDGLEIDLPERVDLAFRTESDGRIQGVLQDWTGPVPASLLAITADWQRMAVPPPLPATAVQSSSNSGALVSGAQAVPTRVLELPPGPGNPRNSEGAFVMLKDGRILFVYSHYTAGQGGDHDPAYLAGRYSADGGRTWSADRTIVEQAGGLNVMSASLLRLRSGELALFYLIKTSTADCRPVMRLSADEGATWSTAVACITDEVGYYVLNNDRAIQLKSGRLVLPVCLHSVQGSTRMDWQGAVMCYLSDDNGRTWRRSRTAQKGYDAAGKRLTTQEPGVVELQDGRVLMFIRTDGGYQYLAYSQDGADNWTPPVISSLASPVSPASIKRLPKTGDLLLVWNDHANIPVGLRKRRVPLSVAISKDDGQTWQHVKALEGNPAGWYCYIAIHPVDDAVLLGYCAMSGLAHSRITRVPLVWLYAEAPPAGKPDPAIALNGFFND